MRSRLVPAVVAVMLVGLLAAAQPAQTVTVYEMYGFGAIKNLSGPGMPACVGHGGVKLGGNCTDGPGTTWEFTSLTVNGHGQLQDKLVNGEYDCKGGRSNVTTTGTTANFKLTWNFDCHKASGDGWNNIVGTFSSEGTAPGVFAFTGKFDGCDSHASHTPGPNSCPGAPNPVDSVCTAVFQPQPGGFTGTPPNGVVLTAVSFQGECTAATA